MVVGVSEIPMFRRLLVTPAMSGIDKQKWPGSAGPLTKLTAPIRAD